MMSYKLMIPVLLLTAGSAFGFKNPDEGMYPLSEIKKVDLRKAGLKIEQSDVYNPNGISLIDALVNVGGCTGSFISSQGLIITNHHCAFDAVSKASTPEHDYLKNGFVAKTREMEIEAKGLTCRITDSYEDVSEQVLGALKDMVDPLQRIDRINKKIAEIVKAEEEKDKTIKAEISEMFIGRTYVLFRYKMIQDVRLVYIPQRSVGEFGGESDNWVWPRHTGDFSFMRAYVAPDGSSAKYSKDNVPYTPKKFLKVNANGIKENDFVFILGYPGRTFRHRPSQYIEYQQKYQLPYISGLYEWQNQQMEETSTTKELELKQASRIKRNANVMKNYKGKLKGLAGLDLVAIKREEEKQLQQFIDQDEQLKVRYGALLTDINMLYQEIFSDAQKDLVLSQVYGSSHLLGIANQVNALRKKIAAAKPEEQQKVYDEGKAKLLESTTRTYELFVEETDRRLLKHILLDVVNLPASQRVNIIEDYDYSKVRNPEQAVNKYTDHLFKKTRFTDPMFLNGLLARPVKEFMKYKDPMLTLAANVRAETDTFAVIKKQRDGRLNKLMADYVDVKALFKKTDFIPDANSTLRLTYGYVRGYTPVDAVHMKPITTINGLIEKGTDSGDYELPARIRELYKAKDYGRFKNAKGELPVGFLYNLDTTGGNSGSPVMNENGELIGVNFDRAYEATINDFAWNESYSRSIGVDIRYVLWVAQKVDGADFILKELGVPLK